jgi:hypothetical protein
VYFCQNIYILILEEWRILVAFLTLKQGMDYIISSKIQTRN